MDLGIDGRRALVCASSQGLGLACALALAREGCMVWINGRDAGRLEAAARWLRARCAATIVPVVADLCSASGRDTLLAACAQPDILVTNNAGPPPGSPAQWDAAAWDAALQANLVSAAAMILGVIDGMRARRFGRIVNITSAMVKSPQQPMALSAAARAGLTAFAKAMARAAIADGVTINNLLPERIDTPRQEFMAQRLMAEHGIDRDAARARIAATLPAGRFGRPEEVGAACAFLCSALASFTTGQNLQIDGGSYAGLV